MRMNKKRIAFFLSLVLIVSLAVPAAAAASSDPITIILQPEDQSGQAGDTISFTVVAFGSNLTYEWYMYMPQNPDEVTFLTNNQSWVIPLSESYDGIRIYCILKDDLGNEVKSDTAVITVLPGPDGIVITRQPRNQEGKVGEKVLFGIQAKGEDLTYTWYMHHPQMPELVEEISTEQYWAVEIDEEMDGFCFYCVVSGEDGRSRKSNTVTLTVLYETSYKITAIASAGGTISPKGAKQIKTGSNQTYVITPNSGYAVSDVLVDGKSVGAVTKYVFENIRKDHTISAKFQKRNLYGDANGDGQVNAKDLTRLARHLAKIDPITETELIENSDVTHDGKVTSDDMTKLARYVAKIITNLD